MLRSHRGYGKGLNHRRRECKGQSFSPPGDPGKSISSVGATLSDILGRLRVKSIQRVLRMGLLDTMEDEVSASGVVLKIQARECL